MLNKQKENGVTLIALVTTIIVLIILAAISISTLLGDNGIITKARDSKEVQIVAEEKDAVEVAYAGCQVENLGENVDALSLENELKNNGYNVKVNGSIKLKVKFIDTEHSYIISQDGKVTEYIPLQETGIYAKLYNDGTLILSSTNYTDSSKTLIKDFGLVENKSEDNYWSASDYKSQVTSVNISDEIVPSSTAYYFSKLRNLENIENISNLKTDLVTDMSYMFAGEKEVTYGNHGSSVCNYYGKLLSLDLSDFNTENVTNMQGMFQYQCNLTSLNLQGFDTRKVTRMAYLFDSCASLEFIQVGNFSTELVESFYGMFENCYSLTSLDLSSFSTFGLDQTSSYNSYEMFACRYSNYDNVIKFNGVVRGGTSRLEKIYVSDKWDSSKLKMSYMFLGCKSLVGQEGTTYASSGEAITSGYARVDEGTMNPGYFWSK